MDGSNRGGLLISPKKVSMRFEVLSPSGNDSASFGKMRRFNNGILGGKPTPVSRFEPI